MITLIIPVYRNEASIPDLIVAVSELNRIFHGDMEAVFVIDGSPDRSFELLQQALPEENFKSRLILLSKNFGSFAAIRVGLQMGRGNYFVSMAADLQEPLELIADMATVIQKNTADVVLGVRNGRADPLFSRISSRLFWAFYRRYVVSEIPPGGVDTFACNRDFRDNLLQLEERRSSLIAQIFWLGFRREYVTYSRRERQHGKSAWTFHRKVNYLMDSIFSFTDLPIRLLIRIGGTGVIISGLIGLVSVMAKISGRITIPGYTLTMLAIVFMGALNLLALGIVGSYAWRAYENTKQRPLGIIARVLTFKGNYETECQKVQFASECSL